MLPNFLQCCVLFRFALLSWTGRLRSPEKSLRNSGSMLPLLLPAVSGAYKHAAEHLCASECVCLCYKGPVTLKLHSPVGSSQLMANADGPVTFLSATRNTHSSKARLVKPSYFSRSHGHECVLFNFKFRHSSKSATEPRFNL